MCNDVNGELKSEIHSFVAEEVVSIKLTNNLLADNNLMTLRKLRQG